jgi:hypothetical protein
MASAELNARRTSARAALSDYRRAPGDLDMTGRALWAERLASVLGLLLDQLDHAGEATRPPAKEGTPDHE